MVDNLIHAPLQAIFVPLDELQHVCRRRDLRIGRTPLEGEVRSLEVDHEAIAQDDTDMRGAHDLESSNFEWLRALEPILRRAQNGARKSQKHGEG